MRGAAFAGVLVALTLLGGALRLALLERGFPARPGGDELYYVGTALNLAEGHGHRFNARQRAFRPPAQSLLLAPLVDVELRRSRLDPQQLLLGLSELDPRRPDPDLAAFLRPLLWAPLCLGTLLVPLTALLGRALFDARSGLLAGAGAALSPTLVASSHSLMSETLFAVLVSAGLALAVLARDRRSLSLAAGAGIAFGLSALTRELGAAVAAACALWSLCGLGPGERRAGAARAAALCAATALVIAPWTWRNHQVLGRFVPVSTVGWFAAGEGNTLEHPEWLRPFGPRRLAFKMRFFQIDDEMGRADFAREYTLQQIRAEQPLWLGRKLVRNLGLLIAPDAVWLERLREGAYPGPGRGVARLLLVLHLALYAALLPAAAAGVALARERGRRSLALSVLGLTLALHVLANATPRFRAPWLPFLAAYAAFAVRRGRVRTGGPWPLLAALGAGALLLWASFTFFADAAAAVWNAPLP